MAASAMALSCGVFWYWVCQRTRREARKIDPSLHITWYLEPQDPDQASSYFRYLARRTASWRFWCEGWPAIASRHTGPIIKCLNFDMLDMDIHEEITLQELLQNYYLCEWSSIAYAAILNLKLSQAMYPERQNDCSEQHKFYLRFLLFNYVVVKLLPLGQDTDVRGWWYCNVSRASMLMLSNLGYSNRADFRACIGMWLKGLSCFQGPMLFACECGIYTLWFPLGLQADLAWLIVQFLAVYYVIGEQEDEISAFRTECQPLTSTIILTWMSVTAAMMLKTHMHSLLLIGFARNQG
eukprot:scaffold342530_cov28-Prasinocladus_malaysianus.AAC.1